MAADVMTAESFRKIKKYVQAKNSLIGRINYWTTGHHWHYTTPYQTYYSHTKFKWRPPAWHEKMYLRILYRIAEMTKNHADRSHLTPDEKIIAGLMLYELEYGQFWEDKTKAHSAWLEA